MAWNISSMLVQLWEERSLLESNLVCATIIFLMSISDLFMQPEGLSVMYTMLLPTFSKNSVNRAKFSVDLHLPSFPYVNARFSRSRTFNSILFGAQVMKYKVHV